MEDDILCGGYGDGHGYDTCLKFVEGSWINLGWNLKQNRSQHLRKELMKRYEFGNNL